MSLRVCLDPGHGGTDLGAVGFSLVEKDVCLDLAYRLERHLKKYEGIEVTLTRSVDVDLTVRERVEWANRHEADLFLSLHTNSSKDPLERGFTSYVSVFAGSQVRRVQSWLHNQIVSFLRKYGVKDLGKKNDTESCYGELKELRMLRMPAITLALLYITHDQEHELLVDPEFREQYAECIAEGIAKIFCCQRKDLLSDSA